MRKFFKKYSRAFFVIFCIFVVCGCTKKEIKKAESQGVLPVKVTKITLQDLAKSLEYVGDIKAQDEAIVYPKVSGKIIEKVKEDGDSIKKGEVIAYIDRDETGLKFNKAPVESSLSGIIGRVYVDIGSNVIPQTPIALVVDMDKVKINLDIPEIYLPKVSVRQEACIVVDTYPQEEFSGNVTKISPIVDVATRTAPIEITVINLQHRLKSGMFARVSLIIQEQKGVPVILKEAILGKEPNFYVYVVENKKATLKRVTLGIRQGPYFEVKEGLKEGDLVVIMGQQRLYEGAQVEVEE